jgi:ankyrin repeat protein
LFRLVKIRNAYNKFYVLFIFITPSNFSITDPELHAIAREQLKEIKEQGNEQKLRYGNDQERQCHQAFKTSGSYEDQKNRNPGRVDGTCKWVLTHPQYQSWYTNTHNDLLWISADPGCGKSVLSKSLVDIDLKAGDLQSTCYFFFKDNDEQNNIQIAICALLHQLFTQQPGLLHHAIPSWDRSGPKLQQEIEELWRILLSAATDPVAGNVICILDALDECEGRGRQVLIDHLKTFHNSSHPRKNFSLKFLITSRPYENIIDQWSGINAGVPTIRLPGEEMSEEISREIDLVIEAWVPRLSADKELSQEIQKSLERKLKQMTHRTYLWLYLVIEEIRHSLRRTQKTYDYILDHVPVSVEDAYERILSKSTDIQRAKYLLHIIVAAARPLTLKEMDIALSIATQDECRSYEDLDLDKNNIKTVIRNLCGLFVYVTDYKVYLIHQTAKEFLIQKAPEKPLNTNIWGHSIEEEKAETIMAQICVRYLLFTDFDGPAEAIEDSEEDDVFAEGGGSEDRDPEFEFMEYAAVHWPVHFENVQFNAESTILSAAKFLHNPSYKRHQIWFYYYWKAEHAYEGEPRGFSTLYYAALVGHIVVVERLLATSRVDVDFRDNHGMTPLSRAAAGGHEGVVRLLLDTGQVDIDMRDDQGLTPLSEAAAEGQEGVVRLLLNTGRVDADARDYYGRTPLSRATARGHEEVVQLLLDTGRVDADVRDNDGQTPLSSAALGGYEGVVRLLLDTGRVDADVKDYHGRTPLWWATVGGYEGVVRLLLDTGRVDADVRVNDSRTPLLEAARQGHEGVVRLLLDTGRVYAYVRDNDSRTPLLEAAAQGHEGMVRLLLNTGRVGADARDYYGRTPLWWAAAGGHEGVVRLLESTLALNQ